MLLTSLLTGLEETYPEVFPRVGLDPWAARLRISRSTRASTSVHSAVASACPHEAIDYPAVVEQVLAVGQQKTVSRPRSVRRRLMTVGGIAHPGDAESGDSKMWRLKGIRMQDQAVDRAERKAEVELDE